VHWSGWNLVLQSVPNFTSISYGESQKNRLSAVPPHGKWVATLPCQILVFKLRDFSLSPSMTQDLNNFVSPDSVGRSTAVSQPGESGWRWWTEAVSSRCLRWTGTTEMMHVFVPNEGIFSILWDFKIYVNIKMYVNICKYIWLLIFWRLNKVGVVSEICSIWSFVFHKVV